MLGGRRRGGMSLGRVAKKAAVATVVNRAINNAMDNRTNRNVNQNMGHGQPMQQPQQPIIKHVCPSCNTANPQGANFCSSCGGGIGVGQQQAAPLTNCPGCKASLVGIDGNFCPYCRSAIR